MKEPIGRVIATEKVPTTMDKFTFWTNADFKLHAFDIVKVKHIDDSYSFGLYPVILEMLLWTSQR